MDQETKTCQNCKNQFTIAPEDFTFYQKVRVPTPTFCPECRLQRRLAWVNSNTFYMRPIGSSDKKFFSMYSKDKFFNIVEDKEWWQDKYNLLDYGIEYDFNESFFEQFKNLLKKVPLPHLQRSYTTMIRSDYCNAAAELKNCYLVFMADHSENCFYCYSVENLKDCIDLTFSHGNELCYQGTDLINCYSCFFSQDCENSNDLILCKNCVGCTNCFGSINLRSKKYHIFNKPYSKEEYFKRVKEFDLGSFKNSMNKEKNAKETFLNNPYRFMHGRKNKDVLGDYIYQSKNIKYSFVIGRSENCKYSHFLKYVTTGTRDAYDYSLFGVGAELVYDTAWCGLDISNVKFSFWNYGSQNIEYCFGCHSSKNLFGCIGLRHKQHCILNKQYTKEEYEKLVHKIKEHMNRMPYTDKKGRVYRYGEFFPPELSPFSYNETTAQEYFPLTQEQALSQGYQWKDPETKNYNITINTKDIPDHIKDIDDSITNEIIECANSKFQIQNSKFSNCTTAFKIIPQELQFYKRMNLPLPRLCPNCRHYQRIKQRNPLKLWYRQCQCGGATSENGIYQNTATHSHHKKDHCPNEFETTYASERKEIVYCEKCYNNEVV